MNAETKQGIPYNYAMGSADSPTTLRATSDVMLLLLDPTGDLQREGAINLNAVPVIESFDYWTPQTKTRSFRIWQKRLYCLDIDPSYWGGYSIMRVLLDSRVAAEWLRGA